MSHRGHGAESSETQIEKEKNGQFLGSPFPFYGSCVISLAHRSCISECRGRARSWATPRPSPLGRPPRNSSPPRKLDWGLAVENRRDRLSALGPERPVRRGWWRRSSRAGAARVRVEVEVGEESCACVVGAFCGQKESRKSLFSYFYCNRFFVTSSVHPYILTYGEDYARRTEASRMSLLDHPEAQALLNDATVSPDTVRDCADRLTGFLQRYLPRFYRVEQRAQRHPGHPRPAQRPGAQDL